MITLNPGINTEVVFTLKEKYDFYTPSVASYNDLFYYFRITNKLSGNNIDFALLSTVDVSPAPDRYNEFVITVTASATASAGANGGWINLGYNIWLYGENNDFPSQWNYEVWGCVGPMPSGPISFPTGTASLLEEGRLLFKEL
jgi:hypothetical protein